jgi:hypothetical protein
MVPPALMPRRANREFELNFLVSRGERQDQNPKGPSLPAATPGGEGACVFRLERPAQSD